MKEIISYLKKEWLFLLVFILIISFSQAVILKQHMEYGFSPDDVWFFSVFSKLGPHPFLKFNQVWQEYGPYHTSNIFTNGILFNFFGFNHQAYQAASLIFKIFSVISLYFLIQIVFKNRLLALLSGLIFSFHYASIGSLEMTARTQDYPLMAGLNIFFIIFYLIYSKKLKNILWIFLSSVILFITFFINPIRAYTIIPFILFSGMILFLKDRPFSNFRWITKIFTIIFLPFILFILLKGPGGGYPGNFFITLQKASIGNLQVFLTPLTTIGGLFLVGDSLKFLNPSTWDLNNFLNFFLGGPLLILGSLTLILSKVISKKPLKFFALVFTLNFFFELIIFLIVSHALNLSPEVKMNYDATTYAPAALFGGYIIILTIFVFKEWLSDKKNIFLSLYLLGIVYAVCTILLTWIFQDFIYVPLGINGYSTLPSMGVSVSISAVLALAYTNFRTHKILRVLAPAVFLILIPYFLLSNNQIQMYFDRYLNAGGMRASDQISLTNNFWQHVNEPRSCNKFFFLNLKSDPQNRYLYNVIMTDRFDKWYDLYGPYQAKIHCPVAMLLDDEEKLISSYRLQDNTAGFLYRNFDGIENFYPLEDFYAFKLQNKDVIDIKPEILNKLGF